LKKKTGQSSKLLTTETIIDHKIFLKGLDSLGSENFYRLHYKQTNDGQPGR